MRSSSDQSGLAGGGKRIRTVGPSRAGVDRSQGDLKPGAPPVLIAGGGEQLTLRAVARLGDACNVGGDPEIVRHKLGILRGHCDTAQRDYDAIEKTHNNSWLLSRDAAGVAAKRERLSGRGPLRGF